MSLVDRHIPAPSEAEQDEAFLRAQSHALSLGVTMVQDMGTWSDLATYRRAHDAGHAEAPDPGVRPDRDVAAAAGPGRVARAAGDDRLFWGGLKGFVDGSLGSTTAWFYDPYEDEPGTSRPDGDGHGGPTRLDPAWRFGGPAGGGARDRRPSERLAARCLRVGGGAERRRGIVGSGSSTRST